MKKLLSLALALCLTPLLSWADSSTQADSDAHTSSKRTGALADAYAGRAEVMAHAADIARRRDLDPEWVRQTLAQAMYLPTVAKLMQPPAHGTVKNWQVYRKRFVEPIRIRAGVKFWQANRDWLERAEQTYGVPPEIVVGIVGVETIYGQQTGTFRVLDALATLAFDFPKSHPRAEARQAFFSRRIGAIFDHEPARQH